MLLAGTKHIQIEPQDRNGTTVIRYIRNSVKKPHGPRSGQVRFILFFLTEEKFQYN